MTEKHDFTPRIEWTGNRGEGTRSYRSYDRTWDIAKPGIDPVHMVSRDDRGIYLVHQLLVVLGSPFS